MLTKKVLKGIKYALSHDQNVELQYERLLKLLEENPTDGRIYALLTQFESDPIEKRKLYEKSIEVDPDSPKAYLGLFYIELLDENYEMARQRIYQYKEKVMYKENNPNQCGIELINILLDVLTENEQEEYYIDEYILNTRLKNEQLEDYQSLVLEIQEGNYDSAYEFILYMSDIYPMLPLYPIRTLLECIIEKEKNVESNQKCKKPNEKVSLS